MNKKYSESLSGANIKKVISLRNMCLEPVTRDIFYRMVNNIALSLFDYIKNNTLYDKAAFILAVEFPSIIDFIYTENELEKTNYTTIRNIESYGVKFEEMFNNDLFDYIFKTNIL